MNKPPFPFELVAPLWLDRWRNISHRLRSCIMWPLAKADIGPVSHYGRGRKRPSAAQLRPDLELPASAGSTGLVQEAGVA